MPDHDPLKPIDLDEDELKAAIENCMKHIERLDRERERLVLTMKTYRQLLTLQHMPPPPHTLAEAIYRIFERYPRELHGREILEHLEDAEWGAYGRPIPSMPTLFRALQRDRRFVRDERKRNTWMVRPAPDPPPVESPDDPDNDIPF